MFHGCLKDLLFYTKINDLLFFSLTKHCRFVFVAFMFNLSVQLMFFNCLHCDSLIAILPKDLKKLPGF